MKKRMSFTLLEILVVTTIISLLGTVGFSSFNTASKNSRDTKRKSDLESMEIGLSTYSQVKGEYPTQANIVWNTPLKDNNSLYIDKVPQDPLSASGFTYYYQLADDGGYYICALLENVSGNNIEGTKCKSDNTECNYCTTVTGNYIASTKSVLPPPPACTPICTGKCSGDDKCEGTCPNNCTSGQTCTAGICVTDIVQCTPNCVGKCSGDNGCEGICPNNCTSGQTCTAGICVTDIAQCTPDCVGKCGGASDGCNTGGICESVTFTYGTVTSAAGRIWLDRNLGATRVAISSNDSNAYGDLLQWGRCDDGHQSRTSGTTTTLSSTDTPGHANFIIDSNTPSDWRSPRNNNLWQGVNGINNPCPSGFRIPTWAEWMTEDGSWSPRGSGGAFASPLKLVVAGYRNSDGSLAGVSNTGTYWSSGGSGGSGYLGLYFMAGQDYYLADSRAIGFSVRCIKD